MIILVFNSCKKENISPITSNIKPSIKKIKTQKISYSGGDLTQTFYYNSEGKILQLVSSNNDSAVYEYSANKIIVKNYNSNQLNSTEEYELNDLGLAKSRVITVINKQMHVFNFLKNYKNAENALENSSYTFEYNNDKYLIKTTYLNSNGSTSVITNSISNGNYVSYTVEYTYENQPVINHEDSEFYTDKINAIGNEYRGISFLGKDGKNLVKKTIFNYNGNSTQTTNYTYEYDSAGRVIKEYLISSMGYELDIIVSYTYED